MFTVAVKHRTVLSSLLPVRRECTQLTAVPVLSKCLFTGSMAVGWLFPKGDGGPSSELIIAGKNKPQPYFPISLICKGFSIAVCLFSVGPAKFAKLHCKGKKRLIILYLSMVLLSHSFLHRLPQNTLNLHVIKITLALFSPE